MKWKWSPSLYKKLASEDSIRTALYLSPDRKLCSKIEPVLMLRSFALITALPRASLMCSTFRIVTSWPSISNAEPVRKSLVVIKQVLQGQNVPTRAQPGDHPAGCRSGDADVTERLRPGVEVREVHLHHRCGDRT